MKNIKNKKVLISNTVLTQKGFTSSSKYYFVVNEVHDNGHYTMHQPETGLEITDYFNPFTDFYFLD